VLNYKELNHNDLIEQTIEFNSNLHLNSMFGEQSKNLFRLQKALNVDLNIFGNVVSVYGEKNKVKKTVILLNKVYESILNNDSKNEYYDFSDFLVELKMLDHSKSPKKNINDQLILKTWKKSIAPKSLGQRKYLNALNENDLVFGLGPAGTGKSYLAVAKGVEMMKKGEIDRIILSRPAVEAGENLGFLPGDMKEKVDPYLRPIYDALYEMMPYDRVEKKIQNGEIEIAPLAFMRGRTFQNSCIIIDEAQNTTPVQMKMILTRIGKRSKMIVNGDLTQTDIPKGVESGLSKAVKILRRIQLIKVVELTEKDVIRHPIVTEIIKAYGKK
tara:strand:+ start:173 stop:1156 length:984 start_codon:yes stop_codon:yes gene_type:complete